MRNTCVAIFLFFAFTLGAVENIKVSKEYTYLSDSPNESKEDAIRNAFESAKQEVIQMHFGLKSSTLMYSREHEKITDSDVSASEDFVIQTTSSSHGRWVGPIVEKVIGKPVFNGEFWEVKVFVSGTIRQENKRPIDLRYALVSHPEDRNNQTSFLDNTPIFLRFQSPVDGMLCVYLVDAENNAYCLLPEDDSKTGCQVIKANKDYLFFQDNPENGFYGYKLTTQQSYELNTIYLLFSPKKFTKANDHIGGKDWRDEQVPRFLSEREFDAWWQNIELTDDEFVVNKSVIEVHQ